MFDYVLFLVEEEESFYYMLYIYIYVVIVVVCFLGSIKPLKAFH